MRTVAKRISAVALSVVLALGMCPAVAFAAPAAGAQEPQAVEVAAPVADAQEPQAVEAVTPETAASEAATIEAEATETPAPEAAEAAAAEAAAPDAAPETPLVLEAEASEDGASLAADPPKVPISKTMTAYEIDINGNKKVAASASGLANAARDCGNAGYCQLVKPSDGSDPTTYPWPGQLVAFALGSQNGYKLSAFNVTYIDRFSQPQKMTVQSGELSRLGAYSPAKTTYEFRAPMGSSNVTVNAVWEKQTVAIAKTLATPLGTTSESQCEAGTCEMVKTTTGIAATKYPIAGNLTAFKITTKSGYKLSTFNVTYTDKDGKQVKLTNNNGLTRANKTYSATSNTYEFTVPAATDVSVNVTWAFSGEIRKVAYGNEGGNINWELYNNGFLTMSGTGDMPTFKHDSSGHISAGFVYASNNLNVPIKMVRIGEGITSISDEAFEGQLQLTAVGLPSTITSIGEYAFSKAPISFINLPAGLKSIGMCAFNATGLTSVTIPDGVESIGQAAFATCSNLKTVKVGEGVEVLDNAIFTNCKSLTSVTLPKSLREIGSNVFAECNAMTTFNVPAGVTEINPLAFYKCSGLKSFTVDKANTNVYSPDGRCLVLRHGSFGMALDDNRFGDNVLCAYAAASGTSYDIPVTVEIIGAHVFYSATMLKSVNIPTVVKRIETSAFMRCTGLTSVVIPQSVMSLGFGAFRYCDNLATAKVPMGVEVYEDTFPSTCNIVRY